MPLAPSPPHGDRSPATVHRTVRPASDPLRACLPPCMVSQCNARGLRRQGPASLRVPAGRPPRCGRQHGRVRRAAVLADRGRTLLARRGTGVDWRAAWRQRAPTPLAGRCAPWLYEWSLTGRAVCCRAPGAGPCSCPLTARRGGGGQDGGRPLAAARGCRLLRRFFFLLKTRNVILAGPRPGQASLRSVRQRTLDMALSTRIGAAQEGGRKRKNAAVTGRFAARGRTACFTPRRHGRNWRSGGSIGTRRCTAAAHSPQKNPLEEDLF